MNGHTFRLAQTDSPHDVSKILQVANEFKKLRRFFLANYLTVLRTKMSDSFLKTLTTRNSKNGLKSKVGPLTEIPKIKEKLTAMFERTTPKIPSKFGPKIALNLRI